MIDRALPPNVEPYDILEDKPGAKPNPFKIGDSVRLRDGTAANGTVSRILGNEVLIAWEGMPGDPQWHHQDYVSTQKRPAERGRAPSPEDKPDAKPNPFKIGDLVRLRDGTGANGTVRAIFCNEVSIAWEGMPGDPQWYHQDYVLPEKRPAERGRTPAPQDKPDAKPNPFRIGEAVRLRDGTAANGIVRAIFGSEVSIAWEGISGDPQWYHQDYVMLEKRAAERGRAPQENQAEHDIVDQACRLVATMDDDQRRRFIAHIRETYK